MLDFGLGLITKVLGASGGDHLVKDVATEAGKNAARSFLLGKMFANAKKIAASMESAGVTVAKVGEQAFVHDALFRVWRAVIDVPLGGHVADIIRDAHDTKVKAALEKTVTADMQTVHAVKQVAKQTVDILL